MGRPRTNDEAVGERLVACATEMLAAGPRESVTVREVAAAAATSATAVYSLFGGKDGLIRAVRDRAVAGLFEDLSAVPASADPIADIYALGAAYRRWARGHRHLYTVLFSGAQTFDPSGAVGARDPIRPLLAAIDRGTAANVLAGDVTPIALSIWVALHGLVTLELAGALDTATAETAFEPTLRAVLRGWAAPGVHRAPRARRAAEG